MPYSGRLENRPLLDVIQIVAYSQQSGILSVKGTAAKGLVIFEGGNIVCAYSPAALPLLVKAAKEADERHRLTIRRIQILAALRELFDLTEGDYRFVKRNEPVTELEGLDIKSFYSAGALDTGDLLLVLQKAMDEEMEVQPAPQPVEPIPHAEEDREHQSKRQFERYGPVILKGRLRMRDRLYEGFLTNLSEGGTFFHAESLPSGSSIAELEFELPGEPGSCQVICNVAWLRAEGPGAKRGAGLSFRGFESGSLEKISRYISRFEQLAADVDFQA
jgi:Tfp pilus assembly protein PilZ